jgi:hypothetical protein
VRRCEAHRCRVGPGRWTERAIRIGRLRALLVAERLYPWVQLRLMESLGRTKAAQGGSSPGTAAVEWRRAWQQAEHEQGRDDDGVKYKKVTSVHQKFQNLAWYNMNLKGTNLLFGRSPNSQ